MTEIEALRKSASTGKLIVATGAGTSLALADPATPAKNWKDLIASGLATTNLKGTVSELQFDRWTDALLSDDIDDLLATAEFVSSKLGGPNGLLYN